MRVGPRPRGTWIVLAWLLAAGVASAGDPPNPVAVQTAKARARVAAKDFAGAFKIFAALIAAEKDVPRETLVEAAVTACLAARPAEARAWRARALDKAPPEFLASARGLDAQELDPKIDAAVAQKLVDDRARAAGFVAAAIKSLTHDQEMLKLDWLEQSPATPESPKAGAAAGESPPYRVREDLIDDPAILYGRVSPSLDGKHLRALFQESFDDKAKADERVRMIAGQIREVKGSWERQYSARSAKSKFELKEINDIRYGNPADGDMVERINLVAFSWNAGNMRSVDRTAVATIELRFPPESKTDPKKNGKGFRVVTWLDSSWFK